MGSVRDLAGRRQLIDRIESLSPDSRRLWGEMSVGEMVAHISDAIRVALRDVPVESARGPGRFAVVRYLMIHLVRWPKGRLTAAPEMLTADPTDLESDRSTLIELLERFAEAPPDTPAQVHPLLGRMTPHDWDALTHRHLEHHLRQFGV